MAGGLTAQRGAAAKFHDTTDEKVRLKCSRIATLALAGISALALTLALAGPCVADGGRGGDGGTSSSGAIPAKGGNGGTPDAPSGLDGENATSNHGGGGGGGGGPGGPGGSGGENLSFGGTVFDGGAGGSGGAHGFDGSATPSGNVSGGGGGDGLDGGIRSGGGGGGGAGGYGAIVTDGGTAGTASAQMITGGGGGGGGDGGHVSDYTGDGGGGGSGGIGLVFSGDALTHDGTIAGGDGGGGGNGGSYTAAYLGGDGGDGGGGGGGLSFSGDTLTINGAIAGGNGGSGGNGGGGGTSSGGSGGNGGSGGIGLSFSGDGLTNDGTITGGDGAVGGKGGYGGDIGLTPSGGKGGNGGDGGSGLSFSGGTLTNDGTIAGGDGVDGGDGGDIGDSDSLQVGGNGGNGGDGGLGIAASDATIVNAGTIQGGNGAFAGGGGVGGTNGIAGFIGAGAEGIAGSGLTIFNSGTIAGGQNGDGTTQSSAITFSGGTNRLELWKDSVIDGNVDATTVGTDDTFVLGGTANDSFDISQLGSTAQYRGFEHFEKVGTSTWTLTGTGTHDWRINNGTLVGDTTSFGGDLTFGTGAGTRGVVFDQSSDGNYLGTISGDGGVTKSGTGILGFSIANTYTGGTDIIGGAIMVGATGALGTGPVTVGSGAGLAFINGSAGDLSLTSNGGEIDFSLFASAGTAMITNNAGTVFFGGASTADGATITNNAGGTVDVSNMDTGIGIGSLLGDGNVFLGSKNLTLGGLGLNDTIGGTISGDGRLAKIGTGRLTLTGDSSGFTGTTTVSGGTLSVGGTLGGTATVGTGGTLVVGDDSHAMASFAGDVKVNTGGTLGGSGTIGGTVDIDGTLSAGNSPGILTIAGDLTLNGGSTSVFEFNTPGVVGGTGATGNDLIDVGDDLTLDGALDARVAAAGYYRLFNYGSTLTGTFASGQLIGTGGFTPLTPNNPDIRYDIAHQVNLSVLGAGQSMQFWDGADTTGNGTVDGGTGTWSMAGTNWTGEPGHADINGGWGGSVGVFAGSAGVVTVDGTQSFDTLQFSIDGYTLTGGTLAINPATGTVGTVNIDNGVSTNIGSVIADGTGISLRKTGGGALILTGANTYTGGTTLLGGILSVSTEANLGDTAGALTFDGGTLATTADMQSARAVTLSGTGSFDVAAGTELGLTGVVSGAGDLHKSGAGTLVLAGANTYGHTSIQAGMLIGNAGSISGDIGVAAGAFATFDQTADATFTGDIGGLNGTAGAIVKKGTGILTLAGSSALDWSIDAGGLVSAAERFTGNTAIAAGASLTFDQTANAIYDGVLSGAGQFIKTGTGVLVYEGDSSAFTGAATLDGGTLVVGQDSAGTLGGTLDVLSGAVLGGNGTLDAVTVAAGGMLAPGNSIGAITTTSLTMDAGAIFEVEINDGGFAKGVNNDHTQVNGAAIFADDVIIAVKSYPAGDDGSSYAAGRYTILDAMTLDVHGDVVVDESFAFLDFTVGNDATALWLDSHLIVPTFCLAGSSANQCATGNAVFSLGTTSGLYQQFVGMTDAQALAAQNMLSGEIHASAKSALIEDSHFVRDAVNDRIRAAFGDVATPAVPVMAYGEDGPRPTSPDNFGPVAWGHAFGSWGSFDSNGNAAGMDTSTGGFLTGIDGEIASNVRLGFLAGYSRSSFEVDDRASSGNSDNYHLGLYGGGQWDAFRLSGGLAYTWHDIETSRSVAFPGFSDQLSADYNAGTFQAFGEAGYRIDTGALSFEPFANLAYVSLHTDGFTEKGGAAALRVSGETTDATFTTLGIHRSSAFDMGGMKATARGTVGWRHAFGATTPISTQAFAGSDAFTVAGVPLAQDAAIIEAGLDLAMSLNASLGMSYSGQISSNARQHGFNAGFTLKF